MVDLTKLTEYREGNRIEAKKALGGLPDSTWESYSSFANTNGGLILLGVDEKPDHTFIYDGVPDAEKLIKEFWDTVNNKQKINRNILRSKQVYAMDVKGKRIVVVEVPRAIRQLKPVTVFGKGGGTFRRNGEGDYVCSESEIKAMGRDAGDTTMDTLVMDRRSLKALDMDTVSRYRRRFALLREKHIWTDIPDEEFLIKIGAVSQNADDDEFHPTAAGLLMFGYEYEIIREFPQYFLDYREPFENADERWKDRVVSTSGDWSGNLYDFYFKIYERLTADIKVPFKLANGRDRIDDTPIHEAIREALANVLIHADYDLPRGIVIEKRRGEITMTNPGGLRISKKEAMSGGVSDARNSILMRMFSQINIGDRAGAGLAKIRVIWDKCGYPEPDLNELFAPDRTVLTLKYEVKEKGVEISTNTESEQINGASDTIKSKSDTINPISDTLNEQLNDTQRLVLKAVIADKNITAEDISAKTGKPVGTVRRVLGVLQDKGILSHQGSRKAGWWEVLNG